MKLNRLMVMLAIISVLLVGCMPQVYHTAEIIPGETSLTVALTGASYGYWFAGFSSEYTRHEGLGLGLELCGRWSPKNSDRLAVVSSIGAFGNTGDFGAFTLIHQPEIKVMPYGGIGVQMEFIENPSISAQLTADFPNLLSVTLMGGINSPKTGREIVTLGFKTVLIYPSLFATVHPFPRLHISLWTSPVLFFEDSDGWEVHAGIGYSFGRLGVKE